MQYDDLASRQAALQKSLSTALLNHQISELESKVQSIQVNKQQSPKSQLVNGHQPEQAIHVPQVQTKLAGLGRIDMDDEDRHDALTHDEDIEVEGASQDDEDDKWRVAVLDASVLIWAPRSVRRLAAKGWELVLPIDAIRTLDLLKKGSSHAAIGARSAARYIEHATRQHKLLSNDPSITVQAVTNYKRGTGIRIQREDELLAITELSELPIPIDDVPRWAGNVLGCAGWFARINATEMGDEELYGIWPTLFVANPPLAVEALGGEDGRDEYAERGEGYLISQEAERFELALEVLRDEEQEDMAFDPNVGGKTGRGRGTKAVSGGTRRGGGDAGGGRGRGREGKNGNGQGRARHERNHSKAKSDEPEREVKILLRRPAPPIGEDISAGVTQEHPSPGSNLSNLPVVGDIKSSPLAQPPTIGPPTKIDSSIRGDTKSEGASDHGRDSREGTRGRGRGARGRGGGRGRGGRDNGPPSPGRGGFVLLQRPGPIRPPPTDGHVNRPTPAPSLPPPHAHPSPNHARNVGPGHPVRPNGQAPGPSPGLPPFQFRPPPFQPRVLQRPPGPIGPPPAPQARPPTPLAPPFHPNPNGVPFRPGRSPYMDHTLGPGYDDRGPINPRKVTLLQRPKG